MLDKVSPCSPLVEIHEVEKLQYGFVWHPVVLLVRRRSLGWVGVYSTNEPGTVEESISSMVLFVPCGFDLEACFHRCGLRN